MNDYHHYVKRRFLCSFLLLGAVALLLIVGALLYFLVSENIWVFLTFATFALFALIGSISSFISRGKEMKDMVVDSTDILQGHVECLEDNNFQPEKIAHPIREFQRLQTELNRLSAKLSDRLYCETKADTVKIAPVYLDETLKIVTFENFQQQVALLCEKRYLYRLAVLAIALQGTPSTLAKKTFVEEARRQFAVDMIGQVDEQTFLIALPYITNRKMLQVSATRFVASFRTIEFSIGDQLLLTTARIGAAIFPYSAKESLIHDALEQLELTEDYALAEPEWSDSLEGENIVDINERYRTAIHLLEETNKETLAAMQDYRSYFDILEHLLSSFAKFMNYRSAGVLLLNDRQDAYIPLCEECAEEGQETFIRYPSIEVSRLHEYLSCFDDLGVLEGRDVDSLPLTVRSLFYNLEISSFYHMKFMQEGEIKAIIYFNDSRERTPLTITDAQLFLSCMNTLWSLLATYLARRDEKRQELILHSLCRRDEKYIYAISSEQYDLTYLSPNLKKLYPEAQIGAKCYQVFADRDSACERCPLLKGNGPIERPKLGSDIEISILNHTSDHQSESILLLESTLSVVRKVNEEEIDPILHIYNLYRLQSDYEYEIKKKSMGYLAMFSIVNLHEFISEEDTEGEIRLLNELVKRISAEEYEDCLYRYKDHSFILLLRKFTRKDVLNVMELLFAILRRPFVTPEGGECHLRYHAGVIAYPGDMENRKQLERALESTFLEAQMLGDNYLYIYGEKGGRKLDRSEYILDVVDEAIKKNKFEIYLQPVFRISDRVPVSAEALLRLPDPSRGFIPPAEFVPIAAAHQRMFEIEMRIVENVGELWKQYGFNIFKQIGVQQLSINLSSDSLANPEFVSRVRKVCRKYHFPKKFLQFEIMETLVYEHHVRLRQVMDELSDESISWSIDNFGSVSTNQTADIISLPFDEMKIDRSCILDLETNKRSEISLSFIAEFAKSHSFLAVAQGVETEGQLQIIRNLGIEKAQGFYYEKPVPIVEYIKFLNFKN